MGLVGVKVATVPAALRVTAPGVAVRPSALDIMKLVALMEAGVIASLKVTVIALSSAMLPDPLTGVRELMVGAVVSPAASVGDPPFEVLQPAMKPAAAIAMSPIRIFFIAVLSFENA
jgi:hypothetical protein